MGILMITHDLSTAAHFADKIAVMYLGRIVEYGTASEVVRNPQHPYTKALLSVVPKRDPRDRRRRRRSSPARPPTRWTCRAAAGSTRAARSRSDQCRTEDPHLRVPAVARPGTWLGHLASLDRHCRPALSPARQHDRYRPGAPRIPSVRELHGQRDSTTTPGCAITRPALRDYLAAERAYYDAQTRTWPPLTEDAVRRGGGPDAGQRGRLGQLAAARLPLLVPDARPEPKAASCSGTANGPGRRTAGRCCWTRTCSGASDRVRRRARREPSPDDRLLAWSADTSGAEIYQLRFTEIGPGAELPDVIERSYPGGAWASDSRALLLPGTRRAEPAVPGLAARARHAGRPRTCWSTRRPTRGSS